MQKPGDWWCPTCGDLQFAKNTQCRKCATPNPLITEGSSSGACGMKPGDWYCPACKDFQFARNAKCNKCGEANPNPTNASGNSVQQKPGDWTCTRCGDLQFAKNLSCRRCGNSNPNPGESLRQMQEGLAMLPEQISKPGDWNCPNCNDLVFARNARCRKCGTPNPSTQPALGDHGGAPGSQMPRTGDWICSNCNDLQFARNTQCKRCGNPSPNAVAGSLTSLSAPGGQAMMPGDWICPGCNDLVFARNDACRRCQSPKPSTPALMQVPFASGGTSASPAAYANLYGAPPAALQWHLMQAAALAQQPQLLQMQLQQQAAEQQQAPQEQVAPKEEEEEEPPKEEPLKLKLEEAESWAPQNPNNTDHVYVKGLPPNMTTDWLPKFLQFEDRIVWCKVVFKGEDEAHALVQFDSPDAATLSVEILHGQVTPEHGTTLRVAFHKTRHDMGAARSGPSAPVAGGSWNCPKCLGLVFRRHSECPTCGMPKPNPARSQPY